jgi:hypothetical protein
MLGKTSLSFASPVNPFSEEVTSFFLLIITRHEIFVFSQLHGKDETSTDWIGYGDKVTKQHGN